MLSTRLLCAVLLTTTACSDSSTATPDGGTTTDASESSGDATAVDAPPACVADPRVYVATRLGPELEITSYTEILAGHAEVAEVTCGAETTGLAALLDGSLFVALAGGGISRVTTTACTALTITPAFTGDIVLVGVGDQLLALERTGGALWRIDPTTGAATMLSTVTGVTAETSLVGGSEGAMVYIPAGLGGQGTLIPLAEGQPQTPRTITGASSLQAQSSWVSAVGSAGTIWFTLVGYFGAGGSPRTMWIPVETGDKLTAATVEYYASTVAMTAATCP